MREKQFGGTVKKQNKRDRYAMSRAWPSSNKTSAKVTVSMRHDIKHFFKGSKAMFPDTLYPNNFFPHHTKRVTYYR